MLVTILYASILSGAFPLFVYFKNRNTIKIPAFNFLNFALQLSLASDLISLALAKFKVSNFVVTNIYSVVSFILLAFFYKSLLPRWQKTSTILIVCFIAFALINVFFFQGPFEIQGYTRALAALILIILAFLYFGTIFKEA